MQLKWCLDRSAQITKDNSSKINDLSFQHKKQEKEQPIKPKENGRKKTVMI